ncbi:helix-turn-helix domain-containing protein [Kibdelosporangium philippinense]|uniref:Helix-turn-helix domain-containing protein n=1 Tax=Kibdelosporangium philippinense TaxID=211113 RepID=A0ABS8ZM01_9PSEU|nr:helix-turn-helix transcriptional regulator [Kibdelosporangium philippinense]MCE7008544.1 helix-turn-helix domain-containing protein [Kibdelosporangium philippinense]
MEADLGPGARRRYLGKVLRRLRDERGLTAAEVAKRMRASQPTLTRIEGGRNAILPRHVYRLLEIYEIDDEQTDRLMRVAEQANQRGWWEPFSDIMPDWLEILTMLEPDADMICTYESEFVPGLLQTEDYARAIRRAARLGDVDGQVERFVQLRTERQQRIGDKPITAIINEAVVRRMVGGKEVMHAQVQRLVDESTTGRVDLRMIPFDAGAHPGMKGSFIMLRFPDTGEEMDLVYVETERGGMYLERPADLLRYGDVFTGLLDLALTREETVTFLATLVTKL